MYTEGDSKTEKKKPCDDARRGRKDDVIQSHELKNEDGHQSWKRQRNVCPLEPPKVAWPLLHLDFSPEKSISTSRTVRE